MVAAVLRKLRRFSNGPPSPPTSSKLFFRIDPPVNFTGCEIAPPPPHPIDVKTTNFPATNRAKVLHLIQFQLTFVTALYFLH